MITIIIIASFLLPILCTLLHYEVLARLSRFANQCSLSARAQVLTLMLLLPLLHLVEMAIYAATYFFLRDFFDAGELSGDFYDSFFTYLYFSMETYTSLGFGDLVPHGPARFLVGMEVLNGLLLIGWSGSFVFIFMQKFWFKNHES